jgi:hypothetical protein
MGTIADIVEVAKLLSEGFPKIGGEVRTALIHGVVYVALAISVFIGCNILEEGSFPAGIVHAYRTSWLVPAREAAGVSQSMLRAGVASDGVIDAVLNQILNYTENASRVRVALIHDGQATITGIDLLRFDYTNAVAAPGTLEGPMTVNAPLSEWSPDYLPKLMARQCSVVQTSDVRNPALRQRRLALGANVVVACPLVDIFDQILGTVFVDYDGSAIPPEGAALTELFGKLAISARQIAAALDVMRPVRPPG